MYAQVTGQNDLYVRGVLDGPKEVKPQPQETDTHWRCKKGRGSFNWRMKFRVNLEHFSDDIMYPRLRLEMWDRDLTKYNDKIGERTLRLAPLLKSAYRTKVP